MDKGKSMKKRSQIEITRLESSIAQWSERPTGILEGHGLDSRWGTQKIYFLSNFDLRTHLHLFQKLHVICGF